jgi:hypothetical protein
VREEREGRSAYRIVSLVRVDMTGEVDVHAILVEHLLHGGLEVSVNRLPLVHGAMAWCTEGG